MIKIWLRVYFNPDGMRHADIGPFDSPPDIVGLYHRIKVDGALTADRAIVPAGSIHRMELLELPTGDIKPNLVTFPGGKLN